MSNRVHLCPKKHHLDIHGRYWMQTSVDYQRFNPFMSNNPPKLILVFTKKSKKLTTWFVLFSAF